MSALLAPALVKVPPARTEETPRKVILYGIPWASYKAIREAPADRHIFLTYDNGTLEIMTLSAEHEQFSRFWGLLVFLLARHFRKHFKSVGSFTQQREDLDKAVENDDCFYIDSFPKVKGKKRIDLDEDPPPDLAFEVDVTHSSMNRLAIFEKLEIGEVWRFDGEEIIVYVLRRGKYEVRTASPNFPGIPIAELARFLLLGVDEGELVMATEFEEWLKQFPVGQPKKPRKRK